jgi:hypothetical protein
MRRRQTRAEAIQAAMGRMFAKYASDQQKEEHAKLLPEEQVACVRAFVTDNASNPDPEIQRAIKKLRRNYYGRTGGWY